MADDRTQDLVQQARAGSREAFDTLVDLHAARLRELVGRRAGAKVRSKLEPADVVQEVFLRAWRSLGAFEPRGEDSFYRWLAGIAENILLDMGDPRRRAPLLVIERDAPADAASPSAGVRRAERFDRLEGALASLSAEHREVILLARIEGLPLADVGRRMGRSANAAAQLLWRALRELRSAFGETESFHLPGDRALGGAPGKEPGEDG